MRCVRFRAEQRLVLVNQSAAPPGHHTRRRHDSSPITTYISPTDGNLSRQNTGPPRHCQIYLRIGSARAARGASCLVTCTRRALYVSRSPHVLTSPGNMRQSRSYRSSAARYSSLTLPRINGGVVIPSALKFKGLLKRSSDRGSQYCAMTYQQRLAARGIRCAMSRPGNCWDTPSWRASLPR